MSRTTKTAGLCVVALGLLFILTDPRRLPSIMLVVPFILIFITLFSLVRAFAHNYAKPLSGNVRLAALGAALPTLLLVLRSLGQLTSRDVITVMALFVITYFYVGRSVSPSSV